ncbi:uncharacterized protein LOC114539556 [Dendronephthya gigantea]|uniref:uncharacterized protein LOC114539556 n=1 Tax=Dendronephthya gigantea TaxID=151771 RepID=UPI00106CF592|nr:uncharacterized protein LOC114539556 [Dendronephthya gigantea]
MSSETPEITVSQDSDNSQRSSVITDAETNNVLLSTMQALLKGMTEMSQAFKKSQQDDDDSWLDDEVDDGGEPQAKRPCLETSVSQLLSSAVTNDGPSTSAESGQPMTVESAQAQPSTSSILDNIAQELQMEEPCAPRVHDQLATIVNNLARERLPDDTVATKYKLYDRPENCGALVPVKVNPPIWDKLKSETRSSDLRFQKIQTALNKSLIAMVQVTDCLTNSLAASAEKTNLPNTEDLVRKMMDAVAFATYANHELNNKRRECIKPELHQDFRPLCSTSNPVTTWLFGDDLSKQVKDMTEVNKVGQRVAQSRFQEKTSTFSYKSKAPRGGRHGQNNFFDRRRHHQHRKRGNSKPLLPRQ